MKNNPLTCNLSDAEFQYRKVAVLQRLKRKILRRRTLQHGIVFYFPGDEKMLDELITFIRTERQCCSFLQFHLTIKAAGTPIRLKVTGPPGAKDFVTAELQW